MTQEFRYTVRQMRKNATKYESDIWKLLRSRKLQTFKFRRQHPIGPYIADFCCLEKRLVVELDGQHHLEQQEADQDRTNFLMEQGYTVVRFSNLQIACEPELVLSKIFEVLEKIKRHPTRGRADTYKWKPPLPVEGEGKG